MNTNEELNKLIEEFEAENDTFTEIDEEELERVSGGKLTNEGLQWMRRNIAEIQARAKKRGTYKNLVKITPVIYLSTAEFSLEYVKKMMSAIVDIDDLE